MKHTLFPISLFLGIAMSLPLEARFLQADPARQYVNSYSYTNNHPIQFADPTGMFAEHYLETTDKSGNIQFKFMFDDGVDDGRILIAKDNQFVVEITFGAWPPVIKPDYQEQWFTQNDKLWMARTIGSEVGPRAKNPMEMDAIGDVILNRFDTLHREQKSYLTGGYGIEDIVTHDYQFSGMSEKDNHWKTYPAGLVKHPKNRPAWFRVNQSAMRVLSGHSLTQLPPYVRHFYSPVGMKLSPQNRAWIYDAHAKNRALGVPGVDSSRFTFVIDEN